MAVVSLLLSLSAAHAQQWVDYTGRVAGAACNDAQWWTISHPNGNTVGAALQCDTWSSRGDKDGSNMTPPFMEYHKGSGNDEFALLPEAEIRHLPIEGLPKGTYRLQMFVRVYVENKLAYGQAQGVYAVANGVLSGDLAAGDCDNENIGYETDGCHVSYGNGFHHTETVELQCEVGDDGLLEFGFNTDSRCTYSDVNWVAWKDVKLYYFSNGDDPTPSDTTQTVVVSDLTAGNYSLRNVATGQYFGAGNKWGVQATLLSHATIISLSKVGENTFRITTPYQNPDNGLNSLGLAGGELYLETNADTWTIEPAETEGCYTIRHSSGAYLGYNGSTTLSLIQPSGLSEGREEALWQFVTRKQLTEELLAGTAQDATYFISNPRFDRNYADSQWEGSSWGHGGEEGQYGNGNFCAEVWNSNFDVYQMLENIPNGRYKLTAQGFYRYNNVWNNNTNYYAYQTRQEGTEQLYAMLYANDVEQPLQSIVSERDHIAELGLRVNQGDGYGMPFSMTEAANTFTAGLYSDNALEVDVTNHKLTIGIRKQQQDGCDWTIWDNVELTLLELGDNTGYNPDDEANPADIPFDQATPDNPVDCSSLIKNADFSSANGWSGSPRISNRLASMGHKEGKNTFDVYQTLSGLPNGWYRLQAQGFYRYGDVVWEEHDDYGWHEDNGNNVWATYTIPYAVISRQLGQERLLATLYGNNAEAPLPSIFDGAHPDYTHNDDQWTDYGFVPGSARGASEAFDAGEYGVELMVPVTDGILQLGVRKSLGYKYDWACWDNMQLFYLGVDNLTYAQDITLSETAVMLTVNERRQLTATVVPAGSSDTTLQWWSSNTDIVQVDNNGQLIAQGNTGTATVYVMAEGSENGS